MKKYNKKQLNYLENNLPNNAQTKFRIGSISKTFTATLIMKLIEDGKLALDTKDTKKEQITKLAI